MIIKIVLDYIG